MIISAYEIENIIEKEVLVTSIFPHFPQCILKASFTGSLEVGIM